MVIAIHWNGLHRFLEAASWLHRDSEKQGSDLDFAQASIPEEGQRQKTDGDVRHRYNGDYADGSYPAVGPQDSAKDRPASGHPSCGSTSHGTPTQDLNTKPTSSAR